MKRIFALIVALAAIVLVGNEAAQAQNYVGGYQFGAGLQSNCGGGFFRGGTPREQAPYFAQYPPVYYSHIVPRPYGISPYAAPAGIAPVEMSVPMPAPMPITVRNPFFESKIETVSDGTEKSADSSENKTTLNVVQPKLENSVVETQSIATVDR